MVCVGVVAFGLGCTVVCCIIHYTLLLFGVVVVGLCYAGCVLSRGMLCVVIFLFGWLVGLGVIITGGGFMVVWFTFVLLFVVGVGVVCVVGFVSLHMLQLLVVFCVNSGVGVVYLLLLSFDCWWGGCYCC